MTLLSIFSALFLFGYLVTMAVWQGIPPMVSDTFYQLKARTESGWCFTTTLSTAAVLMMVCLLDSGRGISVAAFLATAGLAFVAFSPNYLAQVERTVHKSAATLAAISCVAWCLSVCVWPTLGIVTAYIVYLIALDIATKTGHADDAHPWYWGEVACFVDMYVTYWVM